MERLEEQQVELCVKKACASIERVINVLELVTADQIADLPFSLKFRLAHDLDKLHRLPSIQRLQEKRVKVLEA